MVKPFILSHVDYNLTVSLGKSRRPKGLSFMVFYQHVATVVKTTLKKILLNNRLNLLLLNLPHLILCL